MYRKVRKMGVSYKQSDKTVICIYSLSIELTGKSIQRIENKSVLFFFSDHNPRGEKRIFLDFNPEKSEKILKIQKNPEKSEKIRKSPEKSEKIRKNPKKSKKIRKNSERTHNNGN
jgi:hypothetical protein